MINFCLFNLKALFIFILIVNNGKNMIKDIDGIHYYILGDKKNAEPATQSVKIAFRSTILY